MAMTILLAALAAQALPAPGSITGWETLPDDVSGRNFLDPASIRRQGDLVRVVVRGVAHSAAATGFHSITMRFRVDCRRRTLGIEAADGYGPDGRLLESRVAPAAAVTMAPVTGMASFAAIVERACRRTAR